MDAFAPEQGETLLELAIHGGSILWDGDDPQIQASHLSILSNPEAVTDVIIAAAHATT